MLDAQLHAEGVIQIKIVFSVKFLFFYIKETASQYVLIQLILFKFNAMIVFQIVLLAQIKQYVYLVHQLIHIN